jgi:two-component system chemotaxis response regulator CheB
VILPGERLYVRFSKHAIDAQVQPDIRTDPSAGSPVVAVTGGLRAVVVDDSRFMRTLIRSLLEDDGIEVVAEAGDGVEAVETVAEHAPDVVTMDIEMPRKTGIEAVEDIMDECPTPVLILSAHADDGADVTFRALERGAVDFVKKPGGEITSNMSKVRRELVEKVRSAAAADVTAATAATGRPATASAGGAGGASAAGVGAAGAGAGARRSYPEGATVVVGASTGGPTVVERFLGDLPREANLRVLVIQHMPSGFTRRFAGRLDGRSAYDVREAEDGDRIGPGEARIAPGGSHLIVAGDSRGRLRLELSDDGAVHGVKPAIDLTMASAAEAVEGPLIGVLLTGMGKDGVDGMQRIRRAGGDTIAQDERTSTIFGMPKRAIETGCVETVVPDHGVAEGVLNALAGD